jgi:hypothetical protein
MSAIGYVTIGAIDGRKSGGFYDAVFAALGSERKFDKAGGSVTAWQVRARASWITTPPSVHHSTASKRAPETASCIFCPA